MTDFNTSLQSSGLAAALLAAGRSAMTQEAADLAIQVTRFEPVTAALIAFTHCCEHGFEIAPSLPNTNGKPTSPWHWDIGPFQLNLGWALRGVFNGDFLSRGLLFNEAFGSTFYLPDGVTPCPFAGLPIANGRMAARRLLALHPPIGGDLDRVRAVKYTGPAHQEKRGMLWDELHESFEQFFNLYK